ncbi:MAG: biosynthetic arginine decarboxylase [Steroidobacteraceae bacterium]
MNPPWTIEQAAQLYQQSAWGRDYFGINAQGHVVVRPNTNAAQEIDLFEVMQGLQARDLNAPVVVRFSDILKHRLTRLHNVFAQAISDNKYQQHYCAVFPIKVNQQRLVVEEVYRYGAPYNFGLEAGSKPELLAVMALTENAPQRMIVCNGFKDDSYIEAVILATKLGRCIVPVVENFSELQLILKHADHYKVRPRIGVRVKLASEGAGRWRHSAGDHSKFGLLVSEILELVEVLKSRQMLDCLQLVHCHPGSQLHDIRRVKETISELAHVYAELKLLGADLKYLDIGGGLGVDYDGSNSNYESSMNYSLQEYASEVVYRIASVCNARNIAHPIIVSESGRATAAHHSVLLFNVLGRSRLDHFQVDAPAHTIHQQHPQCLLDLRDAYESISDTRLIECYHDATQARIDALQMFKLGYLSLEYRGLAERWFWATCTRIRDRCRQLQKVPESLLELDSMLSDTYFCNFSLFQSLPDSWAIDQLFPIMPIHRLQERPTRQAVLADITCDSDGKIDQFVGHGHTPRSLAVHELDDNDYFLGVFLVGAYQETLGDLHNLFGDTHVVHIRLHDEGGWWIEEIVKGDTAAEVLSYMQYSADELYPKLARDCERAVREQRLTLQESQALRRFYESELNGYTYLEAD